MASDIGILRRAWMELAYFSGYFRLKQRQSGGAGVILRFERVRPRDSRPFQPNRWREITPQFLDRTIQALKRWNFDLITMDEVCRRAVTLPRANRFACLTFDGGCKDVITQAYPVLSKQGVPFTIYLPTAFPDGLGEPWWLALEEMIAREDRISLVIDGKERRFATGSISGKYDTFEFLANWMRTLPPPDLLFAIHDLCTRYSVDLAALSRAASMDWNDLTKLAADPLVTIGSATVNYSALSKLKAADAQREMTMGKAVAETALRRTVSHFAYPFGDRQSWRREHVVMAQEAGFASAVSTIPGVVEAKGYTNLHALPRIAWDGRQASLRTMRVLLSGMMFPAVRPTRDNWV
ncbi:polysaccharide deacetylase family protein [Bradyrhizobium sp. sBnM-33]|uniref:polysaccharide deacetylase family protein n=1 Tax=Bradyrhizobium sp. sBnM-33 TaxID=2831780 RepID=UPI001BCF712E|nr:polysaccharide deacetylase family protein [Bradyrhizobium sp. sBnM-33]WOH47191.1 polysaccharide deacetylase family protein [Bradyrhizobium sp. sBnM-33]